jgi:HEAT repeat protein
MGEMANRLFGADRPPLFFNLWIEGLATCESMRLDGDGKTVDALMSRELAALSAPDVRRLAGELRGRMGSTAEADYRDFFWMSGERPGVPKRAAYAIGALVADRIIARQGLTRAVKLKGEPLRRAIAQALDAIGSETFQLDWDKACHA